MIQEEVNTWRFKNNNNLWNYQCSQSGNQSQCSCHSVQTQPDNAWFTDFYLAFPIESTSL